jgi:hypothetical protein
MPGKDRGGALYAATALRYAPCICTQHLQRRSPATASTANNFALCFFLVVMVALLSGFKVDLVHQPLP